MNPAPAGAGPIRRAGGGLAGLAILGAAVALGYGSVFTLLGDIRETYGFSDADLGWIAAAGFAAGFVAQVSLSRYADRGRGRTLIRGGMVAALCGALVLASASELWHFVGGRLLMGLGGGMVVPSLRRAVISLDPERMGDNLGRLAAADITGFVLGPLLAAGLAEMGDVHLPFVALALIYGSLVPLAALVDVPAASEAPRTAVHRVLLRRPEVRSVLALAVAFYAVLGVWEVTWSPLLTDLGAATWFIGVSVSAFTLPMIFLAPLGGRTAQRRGGPHVARVSVLVAAACTLVYGLAGEAGIGSSAETAVIAVILVVSLVHAVADAFTMTANQVGMATEAPSEHLAAAQGLLAAVGLAVSGVASMGGAALYDAGGPLGVYGLTAAVLVVLVVASARWSARAAAPVPAAPSLESS